MSNWNLANCLDTVAEILGDEEALIQGASRRSWSEVERRARNLAAWMLERGVSHQGKLAIYTYNHPAYMESTYAGFKAAICQAVIKPRDVALRQCIAVAQARPTVAAVHKLIGKPEREVGMVAKIGHRRDIERGRPVSTHAHGVGVVETDRPRHADAALRERRADRLVVRKRRAALPGKDFVCDGAGILRVNIDFAGEQRIPQQTRSAEPGPVSRFSAGLL